MEPRERTSASAVLFLAQLSFGGFCLLRGILRVLTQLPLLWASTTAKYFLPILFRVWSLGCHDYHLLMWELRARWMLGHSWYIAACPRLSTTVLLAHSFRQKCQKKVPWITDTWRPFMAIVSKCQTIFSWSFYLEQVSDFTLFFLSMMLTSAPVRFAEFDFFSLEMYLVSGRIYVSQICLEPWVQKW